MNLFNKISRPTLSPRCLVDAIPFTGLAGWLWWLRGVRDYTMVGDSINIASRLQGKAASGKISVTDAAYKPIGAAFPGAVRVE